jgi:arginine deiminase
MVSPTSTPKPGASGSAAWNALRVRHRWPDSGCTGLQPVACSIPARASRTTSPRPPPAARWAGSVAMVISTSPAATGSISAAASAALSSRSASRNSKARDPPFSRLSISRTADAPVSIAAAFPRLRACWTTVAPAAAAAAAVRSVEPSSTTTTRSTPGNRATASTVAATRVCSFLAGITTATPETVTVGDLTDKPTATRENRRTLVDVTTPSLGADSEVGQLRTVLLHRPGPELKRLTPRNNDKLLFDGIPWVGRAQEEHDAFAQALGDHGVEVLYLTDLLAETLAVAEARQYCLTAVLNDPRHGDALRTVLRSHLDQLHPDDLAIVLIAGLAHEELRTGRGLVYRLMDRHDFVIDPLPNLLFTRDSSVWIGDQVAITSLAMPARQRETTLTGAIFTHHPRFRGTRHVYDPGLETLEGGDILLMAPGVVAVGTGERTTPAGVERLAQQLFDQGLARTVLAVPIAQKRATMHLDTVCTMVDIDAVVMYPNVADELVAIALTPGEGGIDVADPQPFLVAAAKAMGIDTLRIIDTGLDPVTAEREQWDDGNNTLAIGPRLAVAYERNIETNARLEEAGIEVLRITGSELGSGRGGPRCMSCPISRE